MSNKVNDILEEFDSLSIEEQETVVEIEKKRLTEKKRRLLIDAVKEAEEEYKSGNLKPESIDEIMKAIDETDTDE